MQYARSFENYDFNNDERWLDFKNRCTIPADYTDESALKRKFFKKYVDVRFEEIPQADASKYNTTQVTEQDFYEVLGVSRDAPLEEIKKRYRKLALKHHPDKVRQGQTGLSARGQEEMIKVINTAYGVLSDPEKRHLYDEYGQSILSDEGQVRARQEAEQFIASLQRIFSNITEHAVGCMWLPFRTLSTICKTHTVGEGYSTISVLTSVHHTRGIRGLYAGIIPTILFDVCSTITAYMSLGHLKNMLGVDDAVTLLSAECVGILASYPLLVAATCLRTAIAPNIRGCFRYIVHTHGFLALWTGFFPWMMSRIMFNGAFYIMDNMVDWIYEKMDRQTHNSDKIQDTSTKEVVFSFVGTLVKCAACVAIACPLECIAFRSHAHLFTTTGIVTKPLLFGLGGIKLMWGSKGLRNTFFAGFLADCAYYLLRGL